MGLRDVARDRLLAEMVEGSVKDLPENEWTLLVVDETTTKVLSSVCSVSHLVEQRVSLVENIQKKRQPMPNMTVIYFISPTQGSVSRLLADFHSKSPLYKRACVFFSSQLPKHELERIKQSPTLLSRLAALKELNLEFLAIDSRGFTTAGSREETLKDLFGENANSSGSYEREMDVVVRRLASVFASLKELPAIRFRMGKPPQDGDPAGASERHLISQRIAVALHAELTNMRQKMASNDSFPKAETCDLVIVDRGVDPVAPFMHEWTYECMCFDILDDVIDNNIFKYTIDTNKGSEEEREVVLGEQDPIWVELRHKHIAEASLLLNDKMNYFKSANKLARHKANQGDQSDIDTGDLKQMVESLPQYREQLKRLSLHVHIATKLNTMAKQMGLHEIGKLEQDLVYGNATSKEVIKLLGARSHMKEEDKVRLLMTYVATHPEKLDNNRRMQWMKLAKLSAEDMNMINNLEYLGVAVSKRGAKSALSFATKRKKRSIRKEHSALEGEEQWQLSRFQPIVYDIFEDMLKGELSQDEYPYVIQPTGGGAVGKRTQMIDVELSVRKKKNVRRETTRGVEGRPVVLFIVGGMTRSELRVAHQLSNQFSSNLLIGATSIDSPNTFLKNVNSMSLLDDL